MRISKFINLLLLPALLLVPQVLAQQPAAPSQSPATTTAAPAQAVKASAFRITLDPALFKHTYTGRVYVALGGESARGEPRQSMGDWGGGAQVLAIPVDKMPPGGVINVDATALGFPNAYADIKHIAFSDRDPSSGKSFETWVKKYVEKKLKGEKASIEAESLD